jgi:hypothetical protein
MFRASAIAACVILQISWNACGAERAVVSPVITLEDDLIIGQKRDDIALGRVLDIAVDSREQIYVLDASAQAVHKFTPEGRFLATIGGPGDAPGHFNDPRCLAIGPEDRLYVSGGDPYIEILLTDGKPSDRIKRVEASPAQSIAVDRQGDLYVVALDLVDQKMIHKYSGKSGQLTQSFCDSYAVGKDLDTREEAAFAAGTVAVSGDRLVYVQSYPQKIRTFDLSGTLLAEFDARVQESEAPRTSHGPEGFRVFLPTSFSRTIVPLDGGELLTILGLVPAGPGGKDSGGAVPTSPATAPRARGYLDIYRQSDGVRVAAMQNPPTVDICCRDGRGRVYSAEARNNASVVVRYRLKIGE